MEMPSRSNFNREDARRWSDLLDQHVLGEPARADNWQSVPVFPVSIPAFDSNHCYNDDIILQIISLKTPDHKVPDSTVKRMGGIIDDGESIRATFFPYLIFDVRFHSHIPDLNSLTE